ncbi:MAG: hypothetical protein K5829_07240 [Treponema sp.]|nr:hypothetical protein [Treponema sp.]
MKKIFSAVILILFTCLLCAESYQIKEIIYNTEGCGAAIFSYTKPYSIERNVPVNKKEIFKDEKELKDYLNDYQLKLYSLRAFETVQIDYVITKNPDYDTLQAAEDDIKEKEADIAQNFVKVTVATKDSNHLLGVPYPKYNSNSGTVVKLKVKDTNFLGSLNTLSSDFNFSLEQESEFDTPDCKVGFTFSYNHPYHAGLFDITWVNDYSIDYTFGNLLPEWDAKIGAIVKLPIDKFTYSLEFYQSAINNFDYTEFDDSIYFTEEIKVSVPITLYEFKKYGALKYTPYLDATFNWDYNGINKINTSLSSPIITFGHSLSSSRIDWTHNFRKGYNASLKNTYSYNFQRQMFISYIDLESKIYKSFLLFNNEKDLFNRLGITADFLSFIHFIDPSNQYFGSTGTKIGERLRGIRDEQTFAADSAHPTWLACLSTAAFVLNLDFPYHLFSTNFTWKFLKYFNFDLQLSPFFDMALTYNKITNNWFNPKDGFYSGGIEVLVYPAKWAGFTVRGSVGLDLGKILLSDLLNNSWRDDTSKFEISFGIGLHY